MRLAAYGPYTHTPKKCRVDKPQGASTIALNIRRLYLQTYKMVHASCGLWPLHPRAEKS